MLFSSYSPKIPKSSSFAPKFGPSFVIEILQLGKLEGGDFKYDKSFSNY